MMQESYDIGLASFSAVMILHVLFLKQSCDAVAASVPNGAPI